MKEKFSKEEKKEHVKLYKKSALFYAPHLIMIGLLIIELGFFLISEIHFARLNVMIVFLCVPLSLIIFEYIDESLGYFVTADIGAVMYLNVIFPTISYAVKYNNPIVILGVISIFFGFLLSFCFYKLVMVKINKRTKLEITVDKMKETENDLKDGYYLIGRYVHGFIDIEKSLPCFLQIKDNGLKMLMLNDTEKIEKDLNVQAMENITYQNSNKLSSQNETSEEVNPAFLLLPDGMFRTGMLYSGNAVIFSNEMKIDIKNCWELKFNYINNEKTRMVLIDVYQDPESFVSNINLIKSKK